MIDWEKIIVPIEKFVRAYMSCGTGQGIAELKRL